MPGLCAAVGCNNRSVGQQQVDPSPGAGRRRSFHKFPLKNATLLKQWLQNLKREGFRPTEHHIICSDHFSDDCFEAGLEVQLGLPPRLPRLKPDAVPTIFKHTEARAPKRRLHTEERLRKKHRSSVPTASAPAALSKLPHEHEEDAPDDPPEIPEVPVHVVPAPFPLLPMPEPPRDAGMQTERPSLNAASTQTDKNMMKSVGMWAFPETTDCYTDTRDRPGPTHAATLTTPVKEAPVVYQTYGEFEAVHQDHGYCKAQTENQDAADDPEIAVPSPVERQEASTSSSCKDVPVEVAEVVIPAISSSSSSSSSAPFSPPFDPSDPLYVPESGEEESDVSSPDDIETSTGKKCYIIFDDCLDELLRRCPSCGSPVLQAEKKCRGSLLTVNLTCTDMHCHKWESQAKIQRVAEGNLLLAAAVLFSGSTYTRFHQICQFMGLAVPAPATFFRMQKDFLFPVVYKAWKQDQDLVRQQLQQQTDVRLIGDGRCDSPGYSAKYGTYTLMDSATNKIVDFEVVQVSEVKSSHAMELEGFKRTLDRVEEHVKVNVLATDRHISINSEMDKNRKRIKHQYDVWHFGKNIRKRLAEKAKLKRHADLLPWIQSISNHLWWCAATCDGNPKLLKEKWISILHHITNVHRWHTCELFHKCEHPPLSRAEAKKKKWLKPGSPSHKLLQDIILDKKLLAALEKLTMFCHTGSLEIYHSVYNKYMPKRQHFMFPGMCARTMLAVLDHNNNVGRPQATIQSGERKGELRYDMVCPKGRKGWVAKPIYEKKSYDYVAKLMEDVVEACATGKPDKMPVRPQAANIAPEEKPDKQDIVERHRSRFDKT